MASTLVPTTDVLPDVLPTDRLNQRGMAVRGLRDELRKISNVRNVGTVIGALLQSFGVVVLAGYLNTWWSYLAALVLMARGHVCLNILGHEAAHRLLFSNQRANDFAGRWLLGYPSFQAMLGYRRSHFAHHRDEMGPEEPDINLYAGYPIAADSWKRKLKRDATGQSALKNFKGLAGAVKDRRPEAVQIAVVQALMFGVSIAVIRPLMYVVWVLAWSTLWRVSNRLRSIAEHGGLIRSKDRRLTTHVIRQGPLARFWMVPYNTGWHLAHHVDMGVPWRNLPALHRELVSSGWVIEELEWRTYREFWRAASSGQGAIERDGRVEGSNSMLNF